MSATLADTLARLRRQAGAGHTVPRVDAVPPVADPDLRELLRRRLRPAASSADRELPGTELAPGLRYSEARLCMPDVAATDPVDLSALAPRWPPARRDRSVPRAEPPGTAHPSRLLCFDTETTGLAGGTGTRAFMVGAADWHAGALRVRQLTMATLSAEAAMLEAFAGWLDADTVLVSYNGRSYDAPLLATRYRLARRANPLAGLAHVDLLHAVRRRWRGTWANCRLATVERELLRIVREDDLPGSEAPRVFRDWLRGGPATGLRRVLAHNRQDVVTLALLLQRLLPPAADTEADGVA